jgi:RNA polymerase sigma-70 factor, ECF subfamily
VSVTLLLLPADGHDAIEKLYREFHPLVLKRCFYMLGSVEEAEDAASEIFLRLPAALRTYDRNQPFERWLWRVTRNYCVDLLRRRQSERRVLQPADPEAPEAAAPCPSPIEQVLQEEEKSVVREALEELPEHYRRPLIERYWGGLAYGEIAKNMGLTRANVATLIFRAKEGLRQALRLEGTASRPAQWAWNPTR